MSLYHYAKKTYYPSGPNPIHEVRDWCYVRRIARAALRGENIPPILVDGNMQNGNLLAGTHRQAANNILNKLGHGELIGWVSLDDVKDEYPDLVEAAADADYERIDDIWDKQ
jgi:hypothetical protein